MSNPPAPAGEDLAPRVRAGDRGALARAITLVESGRGDHRTAAARLLESLADSSGPSLRLGVSGAPGVGKSTFIEAMGLHAVSEGRKVAVLAVDPSSSLSGGSILGDKTRMPRLSRSPRAFVRPSPSGDVAGGVARRTREAVLLCEAAGFDLVIVETVGVGQADTAVSEMTDMFMLLLLPGAGDELQGIKRGIVELADLVLITKADGKLRDAALCTAADYRQALRLLRRRNPDWEVPVEVCSALQGEGVAEAWELIERFHAMQLETNTLDVRRSRQAKAWLWHAVAEELTSALKADPGIAGELAELEAAVGSGRKPATLAAAGLVARFLSRRQSDRNP